MKNFLAILPALALAACGNEAAPAPEPKPTETEMPMSDKAPPDEELFQTKFAEACPGAKPVTAAFCKHAMGSDQASCEYSQSNDKVLRKDAELSAAGNTWTLADADTVCKQ